jgi:hypothetical protein
MGLYDDPRPRIREIIADGNCTSCFAPVYSFGNAYSARSHCMVICEECFNEITNLNNWEMLKKPSHLRVVK